MLISSQSVTHFDSRHKTHLVSVISKHAVNILCKCASSVSSDTQNFLGLFFRLSSTRILICFPPWNAKVFPVQLEQTLVHLFLFPCSEKVLGTPEEFEDRWQWWWQRRQTVRKAVSKFLCFCKDKRSILYSQTKGNTITTISPQDIFFSRLFSMQPHNKVYFSNFLSISNVIWFFWLHCVCSPCSQWEIG